MTSLPLRVLAGLVTDGKPRWMSPDEVHITRPSHQSDKLVATVL